MQSAKKHLPKKDTFRIAPIASALGLICCAEDKKSAHLVNPIDLEIAHHSIRRAFHQYPVTPGWLMLNFLSKTSHNLQKWLFKLGSDARGYPELNGMTNLLLEQEIRNAIEKNHAEQIVMLNGGFNSVMLRLSKAYPNVQFFDVDHGGTLDIKLETIESLKKNGSDATKTYCNGSNNLHFVDGDIHQFQQLTDKLAAQGFQKNADSFAIAHGVTIYLNADDNHAFLDSIKNNLLTENSKMLVNYLDDASGIPVINKIALAKTNEKKVGFNLDRSQVPAFMDKHDLTVTEKLLCEDILKQARNLDEIPTHQHKQEISFYMVCPVSSNNKRVTDIKDVPDIQVTKAIKPELTFHNKAC